jgi:hypothetical protein
MNIGEGFWMQAGGIHGKNGYQTGCALNQIQDNNIFRAAKGAGNRVIIGAKSLNQGN